MQLGVWGSVVSSPSGVWGSGRSPSRQTIWCILESKSAALVASVFVDFPKNMCNFLHKNKLYMVRRVQFLTGRRPRRSFSPGGSRHHCPMEVGAYGWGNLFVQYSTPSKLSVSQQLRYIAVNNSEWNIHFRVYLSGARSESPLPIVSRTCSV